MIEHLRHMAEVRPEGPDRDAAQWAIETIDALQAQLDHSAICALMATEEQIVAILRRDIRLVAKTDDERDMCADCGEAMFWRVKEGCLEACARALLSGSPVAPRQGQDQP